MLDSCTYVALGLAIVLCAVLGGNNFSTCLGASLGAGIVKFSHAILIASAGIFLGTLLEGYKLSDVFNGQMLPAPSASELVVVLLSSLLIMIVVTLSRLPLSLSQVMVGAGWGLAIATGTQLQGAYSAEVVASWLLSPALAFLVAAAIESTVLRLSRTVKDILSLNRLYAYLTLVAGFYAAYTLGANTLGLVVGLFPLRTAEPMLLPVILAFGAVFGVVFLSADTARSVAENLVGLNPSSALSAQFGGALSVHLCTQLGLPVSVSQVVIGGMGGAASVKRIAITNKRILQQIIAGWTIGPLAGAVLSFLIMKAI